MALSVEVGLGVLGELLEQEVGGLVGQKGKWNREQTAVRHGHEDGEVTLGGRRVAVKRPRARTADGESEVPLSTYEHFADRDQLGEVVLERMLAGVSTRQYRRAQEPIGEQVEAGARSTSKSAVSRTFVQRTRDLLWKLMNRPLADLRLAVIMLDGIEFAAVRTSSRWGSRPRATSSRSGCGTDRRERDRRLPRCSPISSTGGWTRAGAAVRHRRIEGASESHPAGVRQRRAGPTLYSAQAAQRA